MSDAFSAMATTLAFVFTGLGPLVFIPKTKRRSAILGQPMQSS
jgi:hypothetical protein